jgi:hypothetical protein
VEGIGRVVVDDHLSLGSEHKLLPVLVGELVGLVDKQKVPFASSDLLRLVQADEFDQVAVEAVLVVGPVVVVLGVDP